MFYLVFAPYVVKFGRVLTDAVQYTVEYLVVDRHLHLILVNEDAVELGCVSYDDYYVLVEL